MPKLEPKTVQRELDQGEIWPVYWLYGTESMKSRELIKRIKKALFQDQANSLQAFQEETWSGSQISATELFENSQTLALGGGARLLCVREAEALKDLDVLEPLLQKKTKNPSCVVVFVAKSLDERKKFSKKLVEKAAVVPCEEVQEEDRPSWIEYLAKRKNLKLSPDTSAKLQILEPWSLDIVDQELEKISLSDEDCVAGETSQYRSDHFVDAFFSRNRVSCMALVTELAQDLDQSLPLLGLLGWNVRHLALMKEGPNAVKLSPFLVNKLSRWARAWEREDLLSLQSRLSELDFSVKQTSRTSLGLWSNLVMEFTR